MSNAGASTPRRCRRSHNRQANDTVNRCQCRRRERPSLRHHFVLGHRLAPRGIAVSSRELVIRVRFLGLLSIDPYLRQGLACRSASLAAVCCQLATIICCNIAASLVATSRQPDKFHSLSVQVAGWFSAAIPPSTENRGTKCRREGLIRVRYRSRSPCESKCGGLPAGQKAAMIESSGNQVERR